MAVAVVARRSAVCVLTAAALIGVASIPAASKAPRAASQSVGRWYGAVTVPGIAALNKGGYTELDAESCPTIGNCSAGGEYRPIAHSTHMSAFVVNETNGRWGTAIEAPGIAALNTGGFAQLHSLSCASTGNCAAGGGYFNTAGKFEAFLINEVHGSWHAAFEVAGIAALNVGGTAEIATISCPSVGNCAAGGHYIDGSGHGQAFVVDERNGAWGVAIEVPGTAALDVDGGASVDSISCPTAGNCVAGGGYKDGAGAFQGFVDAELDGVWGAAMELPGTQALNVGHDATVSEVSCPSPGNCSVGGRYRDGHNHDQVFVDDEVQGTWSHAAELPRSGNLNAGGAALLTALSCPSAGDCATGGSYTDGRHRIQSFLANEVLGRWHGALGVPGTQALNVEGSGEGISAISCIAPGTCAAGGDYQDSRGGSPVYVVNEVGGVWNTARELPGSSALNTGDSATIFAISCTTSGWCDAGGNYLDNGPFEDMVSAYFSAPTVTTIAPAVGPAHGGTSVVIRGTHLYDVKAVLFGGRHARFRVVNSSTIRATAPPGRGTVGVQVTTLGGTSVVRSRFTYALVPEVLSVTPARGSANGGTVVTIAGANYLGTPTVYFGAKTGTHVVLLSSRAIRVTTPAGSGTVRVRVHTPGGISTSNVTFTY